MERREMHILFQIKARFSPRPTTIPGSNRSVQNVYLTMPSAACVSGCIYTHAHGTSCKLKMQSTSLPWLRFSSSNPAMMRSPKTFLAAVLVLIFLASGSGAAARPVVREAGGLDAVRSHVVAAEFTGTDSSAQPSNCTYGNNTGGQCPPSVGN